MRDEILTYWDMCARENMSLQKGMNFREPPRPSIVLMSQRKGAPYEDSLSGDGKVLSYEGHDVKRRPGEDPKTVDQPWEDTPGRISENAKFANASVFDADHDAVLVRVYEKIRQGIWTDKGLFHLVGYKYAYKPTENRKVFKFALELSDQEADAYTPQEVSHRRVIPSWVKQRVYKRDKGRCVLCQSTDQLHFDHELPFSRGGASVMPENVRLLCARHNLMKGARIE